MKKIIISLLSFMLLNANAVEVEKNDIQETENPTFNCDEFRPNLITKFVWREGPTRELLYRKCLDQTADDKNFEKYSDSLIKGDNIQKILVDVNNVKTRLTFYTLANSLKIYLTNEKTSDTTIKSIKKITDRFKEQYKIMKPKLDKEILTLKKKEIIRNNRATELMQIVVTSEEELDQKIEKTIRYLDFILKDHNNYVSMHNKFFPEIYVKPKNFKNANLTKDECEFLELNFEEEWVFVKKELKIKCIDKKV